MKRFKTVLWGIYLRVVFWCAWAVLNITRIHIRGALVMIWHQGKILLVQKSYRKAWSIPGGLLKRGERWTQAAVRETFEEVGISLDEKALVHIKEVHGDFGPNDRARLFEVRLDDPPTVKIDGQEIINAAFFSTEEALKLDLYHHVKAYLRDPEQVGGK